MKLETKKAIEEAINCNSEENGSDTPDFLLAEFLGDCLDAWNSAVKKREAWYGRPCGDGAQILGDPPAGLTRVLAEADAVEITLRPTPAMREMLGEQLAAYAHEAWSGWMRYLFTKGGCMVQEADGRFGFSIDADHCTRWLRQAETPYASLPESEKGSDRQEAEHILNIVLPKLGGGQ